MTPRQTALRAAACVRSGGGIAEPDRGGQLRPVGGFRSSGPTPPENWGRHAPHGGRRRDPRHSITENRPEVVKLTELAAHDSKL